MAVFDGTLSVATNNPSTGLAKRLNEIKNKMNDLSDEEWETLEEADMSVFRMYIT